MTQTPNAKSDPGKSGQLGVAAGGSDYNTHLAIIWQVLRRVRTAALVKIDACTKSSQVDGIGFVNATVLVNMTDGVFTGYPHQSMFNLCYTRVAAGPNAIIMDPQPGDIGLAVICDRDISTVKGTMKQALPGSGRMFDLMDGVYCFSCLSPGGAPTQFIQFVNGGGINWQDSFGNVLASDSDGLKVNGVLFDRSQNVSNVAEATSQSGVKLTQHVHPGVQSGGSNTGLPTG